MKNKMENHVCEYPGCESQANIDNPADFVGGSVMVCNYHLLVILGGPFDVAEKKLTGPFHFVELIERVMGAREMTKITQPKTASELLEKRGHDGTKKIS